MVADVSHMVVDSFLELSVCLNTSQHLRKGMVDLYRQMRFEEFDLEVPRNKCATRLDTGAIHFP